jgi:hypothetical protein
VFLSIIGLIEFFELVTTRTNDYIIRTNIHALQITTAYTHSSQFVLPYPLLRELVYRTVT